MSRHSRRAGVSIPLFSLRSTRSWGIGEIGDLPAMAAWLRAAHQSVLQILPLNALAPSETSPYSALSAMAIDPQFISIRMLEDGARLEKAVAHEVEIARRSPRIDYKRVRSLKHRALKASFERFFETEWLEETDTAAGLRAYIHREAWWLDEFSLYRALRAEAGEQAWVVWPLELRDRDPAALAAARERLTNEILFHQYVQWIAEGQWRTVRRATEGVEIFGDFPFMVTLDSADVWSRRHDFLVDTQVGTPPDAFSETGQEWGLPPYNWTAARANGFEWLRMRTRRQAELCDGFRVDHLVGFYRTFVRPLDGRDPYFLPAAEEEQRALGEEVMRIMLQTGADVSVEDLGVVPDFVRESIASLGLPGYKVLRWEPDDPIMFPPLSVAMSGTHDTEPLATWFDSLTDAEREERGFTTAVFDERARDELLVRIYNAGSNLVLLPFQDLFGWRDRINQPGTVGDGNWTYALPWPIDRLMDQAEACERADFLAGLSYQTGRWSPPLGADD